MNKLDYKEMFQCGYCDCSGCKHKQTDGVQGDEDWFCGFIDKDSPIPLDDLEECPLGDKMPYEYMDDETLAIFTINGGTVLW